MDRSDRRQKMNLKGALNRIEDALRSLDTVVVEKTTPSTAPAPSLPAHSMKLISDLKAQLEALSK